MKDSVIIESNFVTKNVRFCHTLDFYLFSSTTTELSPAISLVYGLWKVMASQISSRRPVLVHLLSGVRTPVHERRDEQQRVPFLQFFQYIN